MHIHTVLRRQDQITKEQKRREDIAKQAKDPSILFLH